MLLFFATAQKLNVYCYYSILFLLYLNNTFKVWSRVLLNKRKTLKSVWITRKLFEGKKASWHT